jgi:lysozyme family protein
MKTTQAWAWLTAGVLALGLNGFYHDGGAGWAHRIVNQLAEKSEAVADLASEQVDGFMGTTNLVAVRDETTSCRLAAAMARFQTKFAQAHTTMAHFEDISARREVALARFEASRARIEARVARVRMAPVAFDSVTSPVVICPRVRVSVPRIEIPKLPVIHIPAPVVRVDLPGNGPV